MNTDDSFKNTIIFMEVDVMDIKNASDIVLSLVTKNFEVLFSKNDFSISMDATGPSINVEVVIYKEASVKLEIDPTNLKPIAFTMYAGLDSLQTYDMSQLLSDMSATTKAILNTMRDIYMKSTKKEYVIFANDEYAITTAFTDIGFTDKKGNRRLLLHRGKKFSYITFDPQDNAITAEITLDKLQEFMMSISKGMSIDTYQDIGVVYFVNWLYYQDEDDENNDVE